LKHIFYLGAKTVDSAPRGCIRYNLTAVSIQASRRSCPLHGYPPLHN
jgi:hypothetical protein